MTEKEVIKEEENITHHIILSDGMDEMNGSEVYEQCSGDLCVFD